MAMTISPLQRDILEAAVEDYCGLWELIPMARKYYQNKSVLELRDIAKMELQELAEQGLLSFYTGTKFNGEQKLLTTEKPLLGQPENWDGDLPLDRPTVRFVATSQGEIEFYKS
jgi:hypothetical protein